MPRGAAGLGLIVGAADAGLPVEIAFLARHGVPPSALHAAAARAARIGVEPAREVLASGLVTETAFYRALAAELGLAFHSGELPLCPGGVFGAILREGVAPVVEGADTPFRFVLAPSGRALRRMLEAGPRARADIAVMTPSAFAAALRSANGAVLARRAAGTDRAAMARPSARDGASPGQKLAAALCIGPASYSGTLAPFETFMALALLAGPVFLALAFLRLAAVFEPPAPDLWQSQRWRVDDSRLPVYTVLVPLYREEAVLPQLIAALSALDYPAAKLDIRLLFEQHDRASLEALSRIALPANILPVIVPAGGPRTKPRALNFALAEARGELVAVYDAEDVPDPQQLRQAASRFLRMPPEIACLQARLVIDNPQDGFLPTMFALEYAGLFDVVNPGLLRFGLPIMLGGTSNHFRIEALRAVGGWDAWNVTEDADIGLRLIRTGYRIADLPLRTLEEAPLHWPAWLKQRTRWLKGYVQTLVSHLQQPGALLREAGWIATLAFLVLALGSVVSALGYPVFLVALAAACLDGSFWISAGGFDNLASALAVVVAAAGSFAIVAPPALGALRRGTPGLLTWLPLLPVYYLLVSLAAWLALLEYIRRPHAWNKTMHGLARSSCYRGLTDASAIPPQLPPAAARY